MTCLPAVPTFRLLDPYVGWDVRSSAGLDGLDDPAGIVLAPRAAGEIVPGDVDAFIPPPRLAKSCACAWFLLVTGDRPALLVRDRCAAEFRAVALGFALHAPVAIATHGTRVAISDPGQGAVIVADGRPGVSPLVIAVQDPGAVAFGPFGELLVAARGRLWRFDPSGAPQGSAAIASTPVRLAVDAGGVAWWLWRDGAGAWRLSKLEEGGPVRASLAELRAAFPDLGLTAVTAAGFCLSELGRDGFAVERCFTWFGRPTRDDAIAMQPASPLLDHGELETFAIDSGIPRCTWHRVRVDAELPAGTAIEVSLATAEDAAAPPDPADFRTSSASDFLIDQPPGRFLHVRVALRGDGRATPRLHRVRLDFPRATSLGHLPEVYREDAGAEDFGARFLALFDAAIEELDRAIERTPALLDGRTVAPEVLPWLGSLIGVAFDPAMPAARRRALLAAAPRLHKLRGTVAALREVIEIAVGSVPVIRELARERAYGALGRGARIGATRVFSSAGARARAGQSRIGRTRIRSHGDPALDAVREGAFRIVVMVEPPRDGDRAALAAQLERLLAAHAPAHVSFALHIGGDARGLGYGALGIDSALTALPPAVLGRDGGVRLRSAVLRKARGTL